MNEGVNLFVVLGLFIGLGGIVIMFKAILDRLPKPQYERAIKQSTFYSMLPSFIGGQILIRYNSNDECAGIIESIGLKKENNGLNLRFSCPWTVKRQMGGKWKLLESHNYDRPKKYFNRFKDGVLFNIDESLIFEIESDGLCLIMRGTPGAVFLYPKSEYIIKPEYVEGLEMMVSSGTNVQA